jgi:Flp pilus assembly pilin Flp
VTRTRGREDGAATLEYAGVLAAVAVVVALVVGAFTPVAPVVAQAVTCAVDRVLGGSAECSPGARPGAAGAVQDLRDRMTGLELYAGSGQATQDLLDQARVAVAQGHLAQAAALLERLELYQDLASSEPRGQHLRHLFAASDSEYDALMAEGSIYHDGGAYTSAYFRLEDPPGGGVVVMDFFIDSYRSGGALLGDDRGHADPLRGDVPLERSRMMLVVDLETGRGQVHVTETCTAIGPSFCNEPRPTVFDGSVFSNDTGTRPVIPLLPNDYDTANQFTVRAAEGGFRLEYDALNGITPVAISVDGTVSVHVGPDGKAFIGEDDRDDYPSIGTYYYSTPGQTQVVQQREQEGVLCGAMPVNIC